MSVKIISYNVNGIRSAMNKDLLGWLKGAQPDIFCIQEMKANPNQVDWSPFHELGYKEYLFPAQKAGYSGVGILSKLTPKHVEYGFQLADYDFEGRGVRLDFEQFAVLSTYFPSGTTGDARQDFKYRFLDDFTTYIEKIRTDVPPLIICGDVNICHQAIDIHNPISNKNSSGFLPEERAWFSEFLSKGFIDSFRHLHPDAKDQYTWWSYRANARANNKGWRIDYQLCDIKLKENIHRAIILPEAKHSDHCPTLLELDFTT